MTGKFYITCAIPYVNSRPHVGHALEFVQGDAIARYHKLLGEDVLTLSGGDENAVKNVQAAEAAGVPIQEFVDKNNELFLNLTKKLNCQFDVWQKGSDKTHHFPSSQKLWELCNKNGDIYKKKYEGLYCVGCEQFYSPDELDENGECREHPGKKLDKVSEENYFFKLSKYQNQLIKLIKSDELKIVPQERKNEVLSFLKDPLQDISISRTNERAKNWGVPVPNDSNQRIYVWFDALNIYQSGIGFGWDEKEYKKWWPTDLHVIGKGIIRFHAVYWPAFLLSAKLPLPKSLFIHGYFTVNGQKMSKTIGNVIDPVELTKKYGVDSLRYYLLAKFNPFTDGDFSEDRLKEVYNADLANGLGNLVSRVAKLCETSGFGFLKNPLLFYEETEKNLKEYRFDNALKFLWEVVGKTDNLIDKEKPWKLKDKKLKEVLKDLVQNVRLIAHNLKPFLPETADAIEKQFAGPKIKVKAPLFPRLR
ncbi:methionine--tRNA ligase [Candidatus Woesebacteria bacterium RIFOXYA1_FULL_40_18]|uniref:Methionine--tRNA ligase n=1 Tax=Candidatus Woesebacteria bacterium RIFOXYA1_FULL_40_18 TaxID=1802532 RepID=A0A1F8CND5_9BACT|nr:MAG: methionine--tRNA ligase [Candidatus Woesebacteria bacterium RIFOXYA1_FULL_40_18]